MKPQVAPSQNKVAVRRSSGEISLISGINSSDLKSCISELEQIEEEDEVIVRGTPHSH